MLMSGVTCKGVKYFVASKIVECLSSGMSGNVFLVLCDVYWLR